MASLTLKPLHSIASTSRLAARSLLSTSASSSPRALSTSSLLRCSCTGDSRSSAPSSTLGGAQRRLGLLRSLSTKSTNVFSLLPKKGVQSARLSGKAIPPLSSLLSTRSSTTTPTSSTSCRTLSTATLSSESSFPNPTEVPLTTPAVAKYLVVIAGMVFAIVVVGGMTRLTESGLSITEWNVVSGILPPLGAADWEREFEKYRATPEWRMQNQHISLEDFKTIYFWEWSHRILGRVIGLTFLAPIPYFLLRRRLSPRSSLALLGIGTLIGCQGAMGWYMVKSGLDEKSVVELGGVARVSQYRLAAHLGLAFLVYSGCVRLAIGVGRDWKIVNGNGGGGAGLGGVKGVEESLARLNSKVAGRVRVLVTALTALIFLTAVSGAFVAGLDAGLVYNDFPLMGGNLIPPTEELFSDFYARNPEKTDRWWRNMLENPTTVQFDHRVLAMTTFTSIVSLFLFVRRPSIAMHLPPATIRLIKGTMHMSFLQVALGISTLIYLVPIHLAATHQAGSLVLLSLALASGASLRRPGKVARELMKLRKIKMAQVAAQAVAK